MIASKHAGRICIDQFQCNHGEGKDHLPQIHSFFSATCCGSTSLPEQDVGRLSRGYAEGVSKFPYACGMENLIKDHLTETLHPGC